MQNLKVYIQRYLPGSFLLFTLISYMFCAPYGRVNEKLVIRDNWAIKNSKEVAEEGRIISNREYSSQGWYSADAPSTVFAALVKNDVYPDPYFGTNLKSVSGYFSWTKIPENSPYFNILKGKNWTEIPEDSPFKSSWWYRTEFQLPTEYVEKKIWLNLDGINYKANVWLNGQQIADTTEVESPYRQFNFDITEYAVLEETNCLALEIFPPKFPDLTTTWVDWNPFTPDKATGIWYDVFITTSGPVVMRYPYVITDLDLPSLDTAELTISVELTNAETKSKIGILKGNIEDIEFSQEVKLAPGETKLVTFSPDKFKQLEISNPRLWWPIFVGPQNLYDLQLAFEIEGKVSDTEKVRFGIREVSSYLNEHGYRVFQVNGKNILIRGGGYVEDLLLRPSRKRDKAEIMYARHMNLNTLRMEGIRGSDYLYNLCDEQGIMIIVGLCCCCAWERWTAWSEHTSDIAEEAWKSTVLRLRNHPSVVNWLYGSDHYPPANVEERYVKVIEQFDNTRPYQSSATEKVSDIAGATGLKMRGPYLYEVPSYWYKDKKKGGAFSFATEIGPGAQVPPIESMRKMLDKEDLWPIGDAWYFHASTGKYGKRTLDNCTDALNSRYGTATGVEDYTKKSQMLNYNGLRAMFEAYARNKYLSTGVIQWMYNSAWPSVSWQLYDYYLLPGGAFYGTKKACEPLHIQYSYDDDSIYIINEYYQEFKGLKAVAKVYNLEMEEKYSNECTIDVSPDMSKKAFVIELPEGLSKLYFLKLELKDSADSLISSNFYWLSTNGDENADFSELNELPEVKLNISYSSIKRENGIRSFWVDIENSSSSLAFAVNPKIKKSVSEDLVLPVFWEDNYFSLLPKETRRVKVEFNIEDLNGEDPVLEVEGWNVRPVREKIK